MNSQYTEDSMLSLLEEYDEILKNTHSTKQQFPLSFDTFDLISPLSDDEEFNFDNNLPFNEIEIDGIDMSNSKSSEQHPHDDPTSVPLNDGYDNLPQENIEVDVMDMSRGVSNRQGRGLSSKQENIDVDVMDMSRGISNREDRRIPSKQNRQDNFFPVPSDEDSIQEISTSNFDVNIREMDVYDSEDLYMSGDSRNNNNNNNNDNNDDKYNNPLLSKQTIGKMNIRQQPPLPVVTSTIQNDSPIRRTHSNYNFTSLPKDSRNTSHSTFFSPNHIPNNISSKQHSQKQLQTVVIPKTSNDASDTQAYKDNKNNQRNKNRYVIRSHSTPNINLKIHRNKLPLIISRSWNRKYGDDKNKGEKMGINKKKYYNNDGEPSDPNHHRDVKISPSPQSTLATKENEIAKTSDKKSYHVIPGTDTYNNSSTFPPDVSNGMVVGNDTTNTNVRKRKYKEDGSSSNGNRKSNSSHIDGNFGNVSRMSISQKNLHSKDDYGIDQEANVKETKRIRIDNENVKRNQTSQIQPSLIYDIDNPTGNTKIHESSNLQNKRKRGNSGYSRCLSCK